MSTPKKNTSGISGNRKSSAFLDYLNSFGFREEKEYFLDNLNLLLSSGIDTLSALSMIKEEVDTPRMHTLISTLEEDIGGGMTISKAFAKVGLMSGRELSLLKIGEETGKIAESLDLLARQAERERQFTSKVRSASLYPVFVLSLTMIIGLGISWYILPQLAKVFLELHIKLPLPTRVLIAIGNFLGSYGIIVVPSFLIMLCTTLYFLFFYSRTKFNGQYLLLHIPGIGRLLRESETSRFGYLLGTLLNAGVPIVNAILSLEDATTIFAYKKFYKHLGNRVLEGDSLRSAFLSYPKGKNLIAPSAQHMISAGSESGRLARTLIMLGERFEMKTELTTKNLSTLLEPALIIIVWLGVVTMAFAIITPIYSLIGGLST